MGTFSYRIRSERCFILQDKHFAWHCPLSEVYLLHNDVSGDGYTTVFSQLVVIILVVFVIAVYISVYLRQRTIFNTIFIIHNEPTAVSDF
jgi:hypothetical protein